MTRATRLDYYTLEGFRPDQVPQGSKSRRWGKVWATVLQALSGNREPVIQHRRDRQGNLYYHIYDPERDARFTCASETEVRQWLEQRYR